MSEKSKDTCMIDRKIDKVDRHRRVDKQISHIPIHSDKHTHRDLDRQTKGWTG